MAATRVCTGAGAAGLVTARRLLQAGLRVTVFEASSSVGGLWRYDAARSRPDAVMYASLRTNLPKEVMLLRASSVPPSAWSFMTHRSVLSHLDDFASAHGMKHSCQHGGVVRFNTRVQHIEPIVSASYSTPSLPFLAPLESQSPRVRAEASVLPPFHTHNTQPAIQAAVQQLPSAADQWCSWRVHWERLPSEDASSAAASAPPAACTAGCDTFDYVAVANGHYAHPSMPHLADASKFKGRIEHSASYRTPDSYSGLRVLVVGSGPSGQDIGREIAMVADTVFMATHACSAETEAGSLAVDALSCDASAAEEGGGSPGARVLPVSAPLGVTVDGRGVRTQHGADVACDVILWCTGYFFSFPFMDCWRPDVAQVEGGANSGEGGAATPLQASAHHTSGAKTASDAPSPLLTAAVRRVHPLYKQLFHAVHPSLAFIGLPLQTNPNPTHQHQADALAAVWRLDRPATDSVLVSAAQRIADMYAWYDRQTIHKGRALRHCAKMGAAQWDYLRELSKSVGIDAASEAATTVPLSWLLHGPSPAFETSISAAGDSSALPTPASCNGYLTIDEAAVPKPVNTLAVLNSTLVAAGIVQCPQLRLLPAGLRDALRKAPHPRGAQDLNDASGDTLRSEFPMANKADKEQCQLTSLATSKGGNARLQCAYDAVQFRLTPLQKLVLDNAMYVHVGGSRGGAPQTYRLQEYRYGDLLHQLADPPHVPPSLAPVEQLQALPSAAHSALLSQLLAHGAQQVQASAAQGVPSGDFLWLVHQMRGWYVAAPLGSQCDPLAGKVQVDALA